MGEFPTMPIDVHSEVREVVLRGKRLEYFTVGWNTLEAMASLVSGWLAGSIALVGFGLDSLLEVTSGATLLWRLHYELSADGRAAAERAAQRVVGVCFLALAAYVGYGAWRSLLLHEAPDQSPVGIAVALASLAVMPALARAKRRVARELGSGAMSADARQADFCAYLSAVLLVGLLLNAVLHWWWADPAAGLVMTPIIAREGVLALGGRGCRDCASLH